MSIDIDYENPGILREPLFYLRILTITSVLSISLQIYNQVVSTSAENTSGNLELRKGKKRKVKSESDWKSIMGLVLNLRKTLSNWVSKVLAESLSLHKTKGKTNFEETRQLFLNGVLTESLDTGGPAYYNSNILSRYFRKDYYEGND